MPAAARVKHKTLHAEILSSEIYIEAGKEAAKIAAKKIAKKFIPVVNIISTVDDIYSLYKFFTSSADGMIESGSGNVFIEKNNAARGCEDTIACQKDGAGKKISQGDSTVFINGKPAARVGDISECGGVIIEGSQAVFFNGSKKTCGSIPKAASNFEKTLSVLLLTYKIKQSGKEIPKSTSKRIDEIIKSPKDIDLGKVKILELELGKIYKNIDLGENRINEINSEDTIE